MFARFDGSILPLLMTMEVHSRYFKSLKWFEHSMFSVFVCQIWSLQLVETHTVVFAFPTFLGGFSSSHEMRVEKNVSVKSVRHHPQKSDCRKCGASRQFWTSRCSLVPACHQKSNGIWSIFIHVFHVLRTQNNYLYIYICYTILMSLWVWLVWKWIPLTSSCCCKHFLIPSGFSHHSFQCIF